MDKRLSDNFVKRVFPIVKKNEKGFKALELTYLNIGLYLIIPILIGVFLGYNMDIWFNSKPFFLIVLLILGTFSSFYNLWKLTKENK